MRKLQLLVLVALLSLVSAEEIPIISSLGRFQGKNGGFKLSEKDTAASLEATSHALFLASLYGLQNKIGTSDALRFVQSLENGDYGYGSAPGLASDLESTRYAIFSYQNLKATIPNAVNVGGYIQSLYQKDGLFAARTNGKGDLRSTAHAVQALKALNIQDGAYLKTISSAVQQVLKKSQKDNHFEDASLSTISATYYGLLLAAAVGYDIPSHDNWVSFIASLQSAEGGFYENNSKKTVSLEATAHAVAALNILSKGNFKSINVDSLLAYTKKSGNDLKSSSAASLVAALTNNALRVSISYDTDSRTGITDNTIVQGVKVKPVVSVTSVIGNAHPNITARSTVTAPNGVHSLTLAWASDRQQYIATEAFDSSNQLGSIKFEYSLHADVAELGGLAITRTDNKFVGYGVTVAAQANFAGKDIKEGETIGIGTELRFAYTLHNQTNPSFVTGDFDLIFNVLDSSLVSIYQQTASGKDARDSITFSYTLKSASIPAGQLSCRLEVKGKEGVHTTKETIYNVGVSMVATEIYFEGVKGNQAASFKLGDTVKVSMVPASFPDLRTVYTYTAKDAGSRNFYLDISSPGGVLIHSIHGVPDTSSKDVLKYTFSFVAEPLIENIGNHFVTFRYSQANKQDIQLNNYDSNLKELFEETNLNFTVNAELHMSNVQERPSKGDFFYGNDITFKFQIKDTVSGKQVLAGNTETANVFLELKHTQGSKSFASTVQSASHYMEQGKPQGFVIDWVINPNAVRGAGVLSVVAHDADGNAIQLFEEKEKKSVSWNVNIGGNIDVNHNARDFTLETTSAAFVVDFTLKCQDKPLKDARLRAVVSFKGESSDTFSQIFQLPVATNEAGVYETSWVAPHNKAPTGEYKLQFFREVDRSEDAQPLFDVVIPHTAPSAQLPVRSEFVAILILAAAFGAVSLQRSKYFQ